MNSVDIWVGDCRDTLKDMADNGVHTWITSPPYYGLRDYGTADWVGGSDACDHRHQLGGEGPASAIQSGNRGSQSIQYRHICQKCGAVRVDDQIGLEATLDQYIATMVGVFDEARRVLRPDGQLWLNIGDSYYSGSGRRGNNNGLGASTLSTGTTIERREEVERLKGKSLPPVGGYNLKPKDLMGVPWRLALALQDDGWWLRQDIVWSKANCMPESTRDRCTKSHEYLFLFTPSSRYYFDYVAIEEPSVVEKGRMRRKRSVWHMPTQTYKGSHFATFPYGLVEPCVLAGTSDYGCCPECGTGWNRIIVDKATSTYDWEPGCGCGHDEVVPAVVGDMFGGAGTTAIVAIRHGRNARLCELKEEYADMSARRIQDECGMLANINIHK